MKNKKAYYFLIDSIVSILILGMGFMVISSFTPKSSNDVFQETLANDIMELVASTKINELCPRIENNIPCSISSLNEVYIDPNIGIHNINNTILELVGELYTKNPMEVSSEIIYDEILETIAFRDDIYGIKFELIDGDIVHEITNINSADSKKIRNKISIRRVLLGYWEISSTGEIIYWGPYMIKMDLWQK
ncbi:hypothetical protein HOA56_00230 [archaeon]|jgi:hypothetical protein|nr:hypothetical protein [archaeon]MBT6820828.1 hypothetical protein [archaeon]